MFNLRGSSNGKASKEKVTNDQASTFSSTTTLRSDGASEYTLTADGKKEKEKKGLLAKLETKKDELLAGTPMGRSNALQKQIKEDGRSTTDPTPVMVFPKFHS